MVATTYPPFEEAITLAEVFCNRCTHMHTEDLGGCVGYHCKSNKRPMSDAIHSWMQPADCEKKNENNDCAEFSPKHRCK